MEFISNFQTNSECESRTIIIKNIEKSDLLACTKSEFFWENDGIKT